MPPRGRINWDSVALPGCQGHPAPCDRACLGLYVSCLLLFFFFFFGSQGPFIHPIPSFSFFPTFPEAEIPHRSHSNVRLSHGAPFLILTRHQSETPPPPYPPCTDVGEHLLYHRVHEKIKKGKSVDLGADARRHETGLSSGCQRQINQSKIPRWAGGGGRGGHLQRESMPAFIA